jgi:exosortase/archaeosortase family protein
LDSSRAQALRFVGVFVGLLALYFWLGESDWAVRYVHAPLSRALAAVVGVLLQPFGLVTVGGDRMRFESYEAQVVEACNGVLPTFLFLAAVVAFPCRWSNRGWGILWGIPAIAAINIARIFSLMLLGAHRPDLVERVHIDVWQTAVVVLAMALWLFWAERTRRRETGSA